MIQSFIITYDQQIILICNLTYTFSNNFHNITLLHNERTVMPLSVCNSKSNLKCLCPDNF